MRSRSGESCRGVGWDGKGRTETVHCLVSTVQDLKGVGGIHVEMVGVEDHYGRLMM